MTDGWAPSFDAIRHWITLMKTSCTGCRGDLQPGWHKHSPGSPRRGLPSALALAKPAPVLPAPAPAGSNKAKHKDSKKQMKVETSAPSHSLAAHPTHSMTGMLQSQVYVDSQRHGMTVWPQAWPSAPNKHPLLQHTQKAPRKKAFHVILSC